MPKMRLKIGYYKNERRKFISYWYISWPDYTKRRSCWAVASIWRKLADVIDASEPQQQPQQQPIVINVAGGAVQPQQETPSAEQPDDVMIPPLQQKIELLKKNAGLDNVYDQQADEDEPLE